MKITAFILKIAFVLYLASQTLYSYDLIDLAYQVITGSSLNFAFGINITNTILFAVGATYVIIVERKRSSRIGYYFTTKTAELLEQKESSSKKFGDELNANLSKIVEQAFPPMLQLQMSEILTTEGFGLNSKSEAEGLLDYVEDLSPMEVATAALLNRLRQEAQARQFKVELHLRENFQAVSIDSGNPESDTYICVKKRLENIDENDTLFAGLAEEAAQRMFFEAESQLCRDFAAFQDFYALAKQLHIAYQTYGTPDFDQHHSDLLARIDEILEKDPQFLTLQVLKGVIFFHHRNKSTGMFEQAQAIFEKAIADAKTYQRNRRISTRQSFTPSFLLKEKDINNQPQIDRASQYYVTGLSKVFLARIFTQKAHRFGTFDAENTDFLSEYKNEKNSLQKGIRFLGAARARFPKFALLNPFSKLFPLVGARLPLGFQTLALLYHCHDFFDQNEVNYRKRRKNSKTTNSSKDLKKAIHVYEKGLRVCEKHIQKKSPDFALHSSTRIQNNLGYARLYLSLIQCKATNQALREDKQFGTAEYNLYFSALESETFYSYPFANLSLLYSMEGEWDLSWKAGIAALDPRIYQTIRENRDAKLKTIPIDTPFSEKRNSDYRSELSSAISQICIQEPTQNSISSENWSFVEGISELSYGFLLRHICENKTGSSQNLQTGLALVQQALLRFQFEEVENAISPSETCLNRLKNVITNSIRMYWHFNSLPTERNAKTKLQERLARIHKNLHITAERLTVDWNPRNRTRNELLSLTQEAQNTWLKSLEQELTT
ncbi:hypothetical protein VDG1235_3742 [Verrucomicrobiia bacterium DG1235]|nr:hypothetical protein VDG1235_3742 [Verrucomicrobiae bacterium DG1235]